MAAPSRRPQLTNKANFSGPEHLVKWANASKALIQQRQAGGGFVSRAFKLFDTAAKAASRRAVSKSYAVRRSPQRARPPVVRPTGLQVRAALRCLALGTVLGSPHACAHALMLHLAPVGSFRRFPAPTLPSALPRPQRFIPRRTPVPPSLSLSRYDYRHTCTEHPPPFCPQVGSAATPKMLSPVPSPSGDALGLARQPSTPGNRVVSIGSDFFGAQPPATLPDPKKYEAVRRASKAPCFF